MIAQEMEENASRQRNFTAILAELSKRGHKVETDVWVPKRLNISMKFDCIVDDRIAIMRRGKFEYQVQQLQDIVPEPEIAALCRVILFIFWER